MSFRGFLITCLSPDALARFSVPSGVPWRVWRTIAGSPFAWLTVPKIRARYAPEIRLFIELISGVSLFYAARRQWVLVFIFALALLLLTEGFLVRIQLGEPTSPDFSNA
jgi:hypothetical protein